MYPFLFLTLALLFGWLSYKDRKLGLYLILASLSTYLLRLDIFGIPLTLLEVFVLIFITLQAISHKKEVLAWRPNYRSAWFQSIAIILLASTIGLFITPDIRSALGIFKAYYLEAFLFGLSILPLLKEKKTQKHALQALAAGGIFLSIFGIFQYLSGIGLPSPWDIERRITSVFPFPNALGLYLGPIVTLSAFAFFKTEKSERFFWLCSFSLGLIAIILAKTEAALIAIPATLFFFSFFSKPLRRLSLPLAIMTIASTLLLAQYSPTLLSKLTLQDISGQVRLLQWQETFSFLKDHTLFGAGLSGYPIAIAPYHTASHIEIFQYPHTILFNIWVELGLLGVIGFAILLKEVFVTLYKKAQSSHWAFLAAGIAIAEMLIHGLVDVPFFKNDLAIMSVFFFALIYSYAISHNQRG